MPVFKTTIVFAGRQLRRYYHDYDGSDLDTYYSRVAYFAKHSIVPVTYFDVVQLSELSPEVIRLKQK